MVQYVSRYIYVYGGVSIYGSSFTGITRNRVTPRSRYFSFSFIIALEIIKVGAYY